MSEIDVQKQSGSAPQVAPGAAEIFDQGYRSYEGPRTGIGSSMRAVSVSSIQRALGLRRKFRFKVVPLLTIFIAYVPALVFMGLAILLPTELAGELVQDYAGYFGLITVTMILLSAFVVPEVMGSDRRTGMFGLYMASPLTRWHYLGSKAASIIAVMSLVTLLPVIFLMIGYSFLGIGPDGFVDGLEVLGKIIVSGFVLSIFFALFGMAASTLTDRPLFASAGIVMAIIASEAFANIVVDQTDAPEWIRALGLLAMPLELIVRIWGGGQEEVPLEGMSDLASFGLWFGACALFASVIYIGYRRMEVTK